MCYLNGRILCHLEWSPIGKRDGSPTSEPWPTNRSLNVISLLVEAGMCSKAAVLGARTSSRAAVAGSADAFVPAESAFVDARADAHATYVPLGRMPRCRSSPREQT